VAVFYPIDRTTMQAPAHTHPRRGDSGQHRLNWVTIALPDR
jgi:hypothetical protein